MPRTGTRASGLKAPPTKVFEAALGIMIAANQRSLLWEGPSGPTLSSTHH
ncbi:hypothetical protein [Lysobacter gummosus]